MSEEEAKRIAEEYARTVPDDIHVPTLAKMIQKNGVSVLSSRKQPGGFQKIRMIA
jgi:hypothetical protein